MTFKVIDGGKGLPVNRGGLAVIDMTKLEPAEAARVAVIERVVSAIWAAEHADDPDVIAWPGYVERAYAEVDKHPGILVDVSMRYRAARAAIAAIRPVEPDYDEGIAVRAYASYPCSVPEMCAMTQQVTDWIDEVLK